MAGILARQILFWSAFMVSLHVVIEPIMVFLGIIEPLISYRIAGAVCASVYWIAYFLVRAHHVNVTYPVHATAFLCLSLFIFIGLYNPYHFKEVWIIFLFYPIILSLFEDKRLFFFWSACYFVTFGLFSKLDHAIRPVEFAEIFNRCSVALASFILACIIFFYLASLKNRFQSASEEKNREYVISLLHKLIPIVERKSQTTGKEIDQMSRLIKRMLNHFPQVSIADWEVKFISLLHYVSRINWPDYVFEKEEKLTSYEYQMIQEHCFFGRKLLYGQANFQRVLEVLEHHHERLDGSGYPHQLKGDQIPLLAQIVGSVECYSAMTTPRSYRKELTAEEACDEVRMMAGVAFEERVVNALLHALPIQPEPRSAEGVLPAGRIKSS